MKKINIKIAILLGSIFFLFGIFTLPDYGINWDTINHLPRGQAYLHFFLTGKKDFSDLPDWQQYYQKPQSLGIDADIPASKVQKRSLYEGNGTTFNWFIVHETGGHPPLSDILSSVFNQILFKQLGLINDIDSYRVYGIFLSSCLVGLLFWWVALRYGKLAGFFASLSLALYPLFWAESHFNNEKDMPETIYWSFLIFTFWKAMIDRSWKWMLASGLLFGLALGTKFNILFLPVVIIPWMAAYLLPLYKRGSLQKLFLENRKLILSFILIPIMGGVIFFVSWPYLWADPIANIGNVIKFYKNLGITTNINANFVGPLGVNTYPIQWIVFTTPPVVLFFSLMGVIYSLVTLKSSKDKLPLLFLLWLVLPIARVTWPGTTIYGGIRQIMEYVPALAILSGLGVYAIFKIISFKINRKFVITGFLLLLFVPHIYKLISIHPAENVYFNSLIGGLKGAQEKNFPAWGNSFGGPYRLGVEWINRNATEGARVAYARELMPNIPNIWFRSDLSVSNGYRSGYLKRGEYVIGLVYQGTENYSYFDSYLERFLKPVYEMKVDDVAVLKVWQNDLAHAKLGWNEAVNSEVTVSKSKEGLRFDLGKVQKLSRLEIEYSQDNCPELTSGYTRLSQNGKDWEQLVGVYPRYWRIGALAQQPINGGFIEPFVGQEERFIDLVLSPKNTCLNNIKSFKVYYFL